MGDQRGKSSDQTPYLDDDAQDEAAAGKMWAVYVAEAEKYDKGLVESWKGDMEGMLIFAGLFSTGLVAFLIESYKKLSPDSGDTTVLLLAQISNQLAAAANGTAFTIVPQAPFIPPTSELVCNILWFISLGLSLTCALVATLVEQWAREFMHKADMRSAPIIRARVFSYLYYGLKRFEMHMLVEITPLLLHASLLFFFAGLVAFLIPVNTVITVITAILLSVVAALYLILTILPLNYIDCPYQTPLSGPLWRFARWLHPGSPPDPGHSTETMAEAVFHKAVSDDEERSSRDRKALIWTMKSLSDDNELEPFIDAIPDVLFGQNAKRSIVYTDHIQALIDDPQVRLLDRIRTLHKSCDTGLLTSEASSRRRISSYQATWAVGSLETPNKFHDQTLFRYIVTNAPELTSDPRVLHYSISAVAISRWALFCAAKDLLKETLVHVAACNSAISRRTEEQDTRASEQKLLYCLQSLKSYSISLHYRDDVNALSSRMERLTEEIGDPFMTVPFLILMDYLTDASRLPSPPFWFEATQRSLSPPKSNTPLTKRWLESLEGRIDRIVDDGLYQMNTRTDYHWLDSIVHTMMSYWAPTMSDKGSLALPQSFIHYLNSRKSEAAVEGAMNALQIGRMGNTFIPATISRLIDALSQKSSSIPRTVSYMQRAEAERSLTDLWGILRRAILDLSSSEVVIEAVSHLDYPLMTPSIVALAKYQVFNLLIAQYHRPQSNDTTLFRHPLLPPTTSAALVNEDKAFKCRLDEGRLETLANFIQDCAQSSEALFQACETLKVLGDFTPHYHQTYMHSTHQLRFSRAVQNLFEASASRDDWRGKLLDTVPGLLLFTAYAPPPAMDRWASPWVSPTQWLNDADALQTLQETFDRYLDTLSLKEDSLLIARVQYIAGELSRALPLRRNDLRGPAAWDSIVPPGTASNGQGQQQDTRGVYGNTLYSELQWTDEKIPEQPLFDLWTTLFQPAPASISLSSLDGLVTRLSQPSPSQADDYYPLMVPSVVAMAKYQVLTLLRDADYLEAHGISPASHPLLSLNTVAPHLNEDVALTYRLNEGRLEILTDLISACHESSKPLFKARETLYILGAFIPGDMAQLGSQIHPAHQLRFAHAVESLFAASSLHAWQVELLEVIPSLDLFVAYSRRPEADRWTFFDIPPPQWMNSTKAGSILKKIFAKYLESLESSPSQNDSLISRVESIVTRLGGTIPAVPRDPATPGTHAYILPVDDADLEDQPRSDEEASSGNEEDDMSVQTSIRSAEIPPFLRPFFGSPPGFVPQRWLVPQRWDSLPHDTPDSDAVEQSLTPTGYEDNFNQDDASGASSSRIPPLTAGDSRGPETSKTSPGLGSETAQSESEPNSSP